MPLALTCPSCQGKLKVPDNMAGRKVRCPKCSTVLAVGAPEPAAATAAPRQRPAQINDEDPSPVEKRRKKKRRKKKAPALGNSWIWMLGIGLTVAMVGIVGLILYFTLPWDRVVVYAITLSITVPVSTVFLVASMFISSALLGGIEFGEPRIAIPKAAILILLVNLGGLVPIAGYVISGLTWIFGLMLFFDLDFFETFLLGAVNWILNFLFRMFLLFAILSALGKGYVVPVPQPDRMEDEEEIKEQSPWDSEDIKHMGGSSTAQIGDNKWITLSMSGLGITDKEMPHLKKCNYRKSVDELDLSNNEGITDKGLKYLIEWEELKKINLKGTKVTAKGIKKLQEMLPSIKEVTR